MLNNACGAPLLHVFHLWKSGQDKTLTTGSDMLSLSGHGNIAGHFHFLLFHQSDFGNSIVNSWVLDKTEISEVIASVALILQMRNRGTTLIELNMLWRISRCGCCWVLGKIQSVDSAVWWLKPRFKWLVLPFTCWKPLDRSLNSLTIKWSSHCIPLTGLTWVLQEIMYVKQFTHAQSTYVRCWDPEGPFERISWKQLVIGICVSVCFLSYQDFSTKNRFQNAFHLKSNIIAFTEYSQLWQHGPIITRVCSFIWNLTP